MSGIEGLTKVAEELQLNLTLLLFIYWYQSQGRDQRLWLARKENTFTFMWKRGMRGSILFLFFLHSRCKQCCSDCNNMQKKIKEMWKRRQNEGHAVLMEIVDEITSFACTLLHWQPTTKLTSLLIISLSSEFALYIDIHKAKKLDCICI